MKKIFVSGDENGVLTDTIVSACTNYGGALVIDKNRIYETGKVPSFMLLRVGAPLKIDCGGILVAGDGFSGGISPINSQGIITVADSDNTDALPFLKDLNGTVIGCSMSPCDTVSLSCNKDSHIVSVRRCITTPDGLFIEPCEISVDCKKNIPVYPLLAACCVLLLCGVPCDKGYVI